MWNARQRFDFNVPGVRLASVVATAICLGFAAWYSANTALADTFYRRNTLDSLARAVQLSPTNAEYHELLAEHQQSAGRHPGAEFETAAELSPMEARYLNRLGFLAEVEQDYPAAERFLLQAERVDRGFRPSWALMNYYFRRENTPDFWRSARRTLRRGYGDLTPIFRLCWARAGRSDPVEAILPDDPHIRLRYLEYLNAEQLPGAGSSVAARIVHELNPGEDTEPLLVYCNRVLGQDVGAALTLWNTMCQRKLLPFESLAPEAGRILTNADFSQPMRGRGFDWRIRRLDGLKIDTGVESGLTLTLTGSQPEIFEVLEQPIPLIRDRRYEINISYRLTPNQGDSGLWWHVDGSGVLARGEAMRGDDIGRQRLTFYSAANDLAYLRLTYRRTPGTVRWSGAVAIRSVTSEGLP